MEIKSPLTLADSVIFESSIDVSKIIALYKNQLNIDVTRFFEGIEEISIYRCTKTGYRFYYPFNLSGDGKFYEELQARPGYYPEWKWEHSKVKESIKDSDSVLEIGCAEGSFLEGLKSKNIRGVGLELNDKAVEVGKKKGINIINESVQEHASKNLNKYDIVCSFQVMEHITEIREVLQASLDCLKKGGLLFISVPNNDSFLKLDDEHTLNLPPHHMGLWDERSLRNLENIFKIKCVGIFFENPLPHHEYLYKRFSEKLKFERYVKNRQKYGVFGRGLNFISRPLNSFLQRRKYPTLGNFTVIAQYIKL